VFAATMSTMGSRMRAVLLAGLLIGTIALVSAPRALGTAYCSETGDTCESISLVGGNVVVEVRWADQYGPTSKICAISPSAALICKVVPMKPDARGIPSGKLMIANPAPGIWRTPTAGGQRVVQRVGPASPVRIPSAGGALAGPGAILYASVRFCDPGTRPATFRVRFHIFRNLKKIGSATRITTLEERCGSIAGAEVRGDGQSLSGTFSVVTVENLRTRESASASGGFPTST
jgi:hypothetical protein